MAKIIWEYQSGMHGETQAVRVSRSSDGRLGRVIRTTHTAARGWGTGRVTYFLWDKPDSAPEYATVRQALKALAHPAPQAPAQEEA